MSTIGRKQVLHVITGLNAGGAEAVLYSLCIADTEASHHVISLLGPGVYSERLTRARIPVYHLGMPQGRVSLSGLRKLFKLIHTIRPDAIQGWMYHGSLIGSIAGRLLGIRNVFWGIHHSDVNSPRLSSATRAVIRVMAYLSAAVPKKVIYCAESAKINHERQGYNRRRGAVIFNGYDIAKFAPSAEARESERSRLGVDGTTLIFGMVARWHPDKDHSTFFHALADIRNELPNVRAVLVGAGMVNSNEELANQLDHFGIADICFLIPPVDNVHSVMNAFDANILSSATEAFPNVIAEAMACEVPCVTTDVGDARTIVGSTGWVVPAGDHAAMADGLRSAAISIAESNLQERKSRARERIVDNYSLRRMSEAYFTTWFCLSSRR